MLFSKPIQELEFADIEIFCRQGIKEGFNLDYKKTFPRRLDKVICAFANTWGGVVLLGVDEDDETKPKLPIGGISFEQGLDVRVTNIIVDNIYPPVFVDKKVIRFRCGSDERAVIVIAVPESNIAPHSVDQGRSIYVRTDDRNKPEERATIARIEWLLNRRKKWFCQAFCVWRFSTRKTGHRY